MPIDLPSSRPDALLLDLGGVVVDIDFDRVFASWAAASGASIDEIRERSVVDEAYERHERAEIDAATYFGGLRDSLGLDLSIEQFVVGWNEVFVGLIPGVVELVRELAAAVPVYGLTNTNPTHAACWSSRYAPEVDAFTAVFASCEIGHRKPDAEVFVHVAERIGLRMDRIHFFDDSPGNVEGALEAGMPATVVTSFDQFAAAARTLVAR